MKAEQYAALGWHVFPVWEIGPDGFCACKKREQCTDAGKHPKVRNGVNDATNNVPQVERWFTQEFAGSNIGLATGTKSDVLVIDVDPRHGGNESMQQLQDEFGKLPYTLTSYTGGGGYHMFFKYENGYDNLRNVPNVRPGVDVRTTGGYVILPESKHISGGTYRWHNWTTPGAILPAWFETEILTKSSDIGNFNLGSTESILDGIDEGSRDDTLFRAACRWRRALGDNERRAVEVLILEAARNSTPPFPEQEALRKVEQAFKQDHSDIFDDIIIPGSRSFHMTDLGNAQRFAYVFGEKYRYIEGFGWVQYTPTGWSSDTNLYKDVYRVPDYIRADAAALNEAGEATRLTRAMTSWAMKTESSGKLDAISKLAANLTELNRSITSYDQVATDLACLNGVVDLKTGNVRAHHHDDLVIKNVNLSYNPTCVSPEWDNFLLDSCNGDTDLVTYMQKAAGYSILGHNREEKFFIISGKPGTGKSTFISSIQNALGLYATSIQSDVIMHRKMPQAQTMYDLARLVGVRLVTINELAEGEALNAKMIKQISGGDEITARHLYKDPFTFLPIFTIWISTNHDPEVRDDAIWRRLLKIPFNHVIPKEKIDRKLKDKLLDPLDGAPAVLTWLIKGAIAYLNDPVLNAPASVALKTNEYRAEQDLTQAFINEMVTYTGDSNDAIDLVNTYQSYVLWMFNHGEKFQPKLVHFKTEFMNKLEMSNPQADIVRSRNRMHVVGYRIASFGMDESWKSTSS